MIQLISRRLLFIFLVCVAIILSVNVGMRMARNSESREPSYDVVQHVKLGWEDTRAYVRGAIRGEFGTATIGGVLTPVGVTLKQSYLNSMGLLLTALVGAVLVGLPLGMLAALVKKRSITLPVLAFTLMGISVPAFFAGLLLRQGELMYVRIFGHPLVSVAGFGWDYQHMLLPVLVLSARPLAYLTRASYLALSRVMEEDYIRTAYAKGLRQTQIVNIHALRNIAVPLLTATGVSLRFSLAALPVVEFLFNWPGMGLRMLEAIDSRQTAVVVTLALALGLTFLVINLLLDMAYWIADPRIREEV